MTSVAKLTGKEDVKAYLYRKFAATTQANERNHDSLIAIRGFLAEDNFSAALEVWDEIPDEDKHHIWVAPTKGGWLTTRERNQIKWGNNDFDNKRQGNRYGEQP